MAPPAKAVPEDAAPKSWYPMVWVVRVDEVESAEMAAMPDVLM